MDLPEIQCCMARMHYAETLNPAIAESAVANPPWLRPLIHNNIFTAFARTSMVHSASPNVVLQYACEKKASAKMDRDL